MECVDHREAVSSESIQHPLGKALSTPFQDHVLPIFSSMTDSEKIRSWSTGPKRRAGVRNKAVARWLPESAAMSVA